MDDVLQFRLRKIYQGFNLDVAASFDAGIIAVFGPSGSGKTTLLNCLSGLTSPDEGEVVLNGRVLFSSADNVNMPPEQRRMGYMFQESLLFPHLNVRDNVLYGYRLTPSKRRIIDPDHLVALLQLGPLMGRHITGLSGGERQRVLLARALATSPAMLLLDEPLASLHTGLKGRILRYLKDIHQRFSIPMVYVSHSISEVMALADRALVLDKGRQVALGGPSSILFEPEVAGTIATEGLENLVDVEVVEHRPSSGLTLVTAGQAVMALPMVEAVPGTTISVSIRAADIMLALERPTGISARNIVKARIESINGVGPRVLIYANIGWLCMVEITHEALDALELREGQEVFLVIKSSSITALG